MKVTKTQLTSIFNGGKTWEEIAADFSIEAGVEVSVKMVHELFKANGFNLRSRARKSSTSWITVIDDTVSEAPTTSNVALETEELV